VADCVVLEDAPGGVRAGLEAGAHVVGVLTSHAAGDLEGAHELVESVGEWLAQRAAGAAG